MSGMSVNTMTLSMLKTKYVNTSVKDNALFLTKLNIERRKKFGVPLIVTSGWS